MANEEDKADAVHFQELLLSEHGVIRLHFHANDNSATHLLEPVYHLFPLRLPVVCFRVPVRGTLEAESASERTGSAS